MSRPREYLLAWNEEDGWGVLALNHTDVCNDVHVIEYSAYEKLQQENEKLNLLLSKLSDLLNSNVDKRNIEIDKCIKLKEEKASQKKQHANFGGAGILEIVNTEDELIALAKDAEIEKLKAEIKIMRDAIEFWG